MSVSGNLFTFSGLSRPNGQPVPAPCPPPRCFVPAPFPPVRFASRRETFKENPKRFDSHAMAEEISETHPVSRSHWRVLKCEDLACMSRQHVSDWQALPPSARSDAAWEMVKLAWKLKSRSPDELRLQRSIAVFERS